MRTGSLETDPGLSITRGNDADALVRSGCGDKSASAQRCDARSVQGVRSNAHLFQEGGFVVTPELHAPVEASNRNAARGREDDGLIEAAFLAR